MLSNSIKLKNFLLKSKTKSIDKNLSLLIKEDNEVINSLKKNYKDKFNKKKITKYKKSINFRLIGMGGSTLGAQTIYKFLSHKVKKNFLFVDNLNPKQVVSKKIYQYNYFKIRKYSRNNCKCKYFN